MEGFFFCAINRTIYFKTTKYRKMKVLKFGGTSVGSIESIKAVLDIVKKHTMTVKNHWLSCLLCRG